MSPVLLPMAQRLSQVNLRWHGVRSRWIDSPQGTLHAYDVRGHGTLPTTVLLHGLGSAATPFAPLLLRLRRDMRRVIAPDYLGHGFSAAAPPSLTAEALMASVSSALDELVVGEAAIVVGSSLGGAVALRYALARPERVRALVLVSPAGARATDGEWRELKAAFQLETRSDALALLRRLYPGSLGLAPLIAHELPAAFARPAIRDFLASTGNDDTPAPEALGTLQMPILLLWGQKERLLPDSHLDYFARHLPRHTIIERPAGFGHCPHVDAVQALADRIVAFARNIVKAPAPSAPRGETP